MPSPHSSSNFEPRRVAQTSTPTLLNEAYTRLRVFATGLHHACGQPDVSGLHVWMNSYGARINSMADVLQDEGAKQRSTLSKTADKLYLKQTCASPETLLAEVEAIQELLVGTYAQLSVRLDMDEELYEILLEQERELREVMADIMELHMEYEAYGNADA